MAASPLPALHEATKGFSQHDRKLIERAVERATEAHKGQTRKDGSAYIEHPIEVATILAGWQADAETIAAALLHDTIEDTALTREAIAGDFGETIASLVEGVTKITETDLTLRQEQGQEKQLTLDRKTETLRKLFEVMRQDIRALMIKMADRLHNVRTIADLSPERQVRFAKETLDIYYKLAYHLGLNDVRREFSEVCVPLVYPNEAKEIVAMRAHQMKAGAIIARAMEKRLRESDTHNAINSMRLEGHSLVSLYHDRKQPDFNDDQAIYVVITTKNEDGCYAVLKSLHAMYRPRSAQFRDYVASPSRSGYRSLHTTVIDDAGDMLDVRIRTEKMDLEEKVGLLQYCFGKEHWKGKEFEWLQRSATFDAATREDSAAFQQALQSDILNENVTIVVDGEEVQVPSNATILDALYARHGLHTHTAMGASRNGMSCIFGDAVDEDDAIIATFGHRSQVRFEWLTWVTTAYARTLIVEALKTRSREEKISVGRDLLQKELDRYRKGYVGDLSRTQHESIAREFGRASFDDVLAMIGEGSVAPGDVALTLWPERSRWRPWLRQSNAPRWFRISVSGAHLRRPEILPRIAAVAERAGTEIESTKIRFHERSGTYAAVVRGYTPGRTQFVDFLSALDRAEWTSSVNAMLSRTQRVLLGLILAVAAAVVIADVMLLPWYERLISSQTAVPQIILAFVPLLPILGVNFYLLKTLRQYSVRLRQEGWFLGLGVLLNVATLVLLIVQNSYTGLRGHLLPMLAVVVGSIVYTSIRFFQTQGSMTQIPDSPRERKMTAADWKEKARQKKIGYAIRLLAVIVWGLDPVYIRYTDANLLSPFLRTFLLSIGVLAFSFLALGVKSVFRKPRTLRLPYDRYFLALIVGQIGLMYFKNASLMYTSGTNFLLFGNFSPVLGLVVAAAFWRHRIPYLHETRHMLWIFLLAMTGSIGSALLLFNSLETGSVSIIGDFLAIIAVFSDLILVVAQIEYIKRHLRTDGMLLNIHIFTVVLLLSAPAVLALHWSGYPVAENLNPRTLLYGMGIGLFVGIGQYLNYEAFKRIDGYLAFMMFNLSVILTFSIETLALGSINATMLLIVSAILIIGSSVAAEIINGRSEKKAAA